MSALDELIALVEKAPEDIRAELGRLAAEHASKNIWVPNLGPQTDAFFSEADEVLYGGQAGGGKSDLLIGLSLTQHERSIIFRRQYRDLSALVDRIIEVVGHSNGLNRQQLTFRLPEHVVEFAAMQHEEDKQSFKGRPHDLIGFDELSDFTQSQYEFVIGWNRSTKPGQRCRIIGATNPPTTADGLWIVRRWAPWLDPGHPNPAVHGELRWFTSIDGVDTEVPQDYEAEDESGEIIRPKSRTFIRAGLGDNPFLSGSGYAARLAALPEPFRSAYKEGRFDVSLKDDERQLIPTAWVIEAQARWRKEIPTEIPMTAIGCDPNGGGRDRCTLAPRYGGWFAPIVEVKDVRIDDSSAIMAEVVRVMRDRAPVVMDYGGGYGGGPAQLLRSNGIEVKGFQGSNTAMGKTRDAAKIAFMNKRAEAWWRFREALDPNTPGGSHVCLPPDGDLRADLCAPRFEITRQGIKVEPKEDIRERLGRSPDRGDAVVMAWMVGEQLSPAAISARNRTVYGRQPAVQLGYANMKRQHTNRGPSNGQPF